MPRRLLPLVLASTATLLAQLDLALITRDGPQAAGAVVDLGQTPVGEPLDAAFRVRNLGPSSIALDTLSVHGSGFGLLSRPGLPLTLAPGAAADFVVRFLPSSYGSYSANLTVGRSSTILRGQGLATAAVSYEMDGVRFSLSAGGSVDFGRVERGAAAVCRFLLENNNAVRVTVGRAELSGETFQASWPPLPATLEPKQSLAFEVAFRPLWPRPETGTLTVDGRAFSLQGTGLEPPLPKAVLSVETQSARSAQQLKLSVPLEAASRGNGSGQLRLEFFPAPGAGDDPGIIFLASGLRSLEFSVREGDTSARFGSAAETLIQTGTTAGTIELTMTVGGTSQTVPIVIAPEAIAVDSARAARGAGTVEIEIRGYDNTRTAAALGFTFLNASGAALGPLIRADAGEQFRAYYRGTPAGGAFALKAVFPVAGDPSLLSAVEVEMTNAAGTTKIERVRIQ